MKELNHRQVATLVNVLAESKIVNLDNSIRSLVQPLATSLGKLDPGGTASIHALCCNEYFLVTGIVASQLDEVAGQAQSVRSTVGEG